MYFKQGDLFWGMNKGFVEAATQLAISFSCQQGEKLFGLGDATEFFYIILKGNIGLNYDQKDLTHYEARHPGEVVGWSALIGQDFYTASATVETDADMLKIPTDSFLEVLNKWPDCKAILFERVAKTLGNRLLEMYPSAA